MKKDLSEKFKAASYFSWWRAVAYYENKKLLWTEKGKKIWKYIMTYEVFMYDVNESYEEAIN